MPAGEGDEPTAFGMLVAQVATLKKDVDWIKGWMHWALGAGFIVGSIVGLFSHEIVNMILTGHAGNPVGK